LKNKPNMGVAVAIGTAIGAGIFSATNEPVWIALGIAIVNELALSDIRSYQKVSTVIDICASFGRFN